MQKGKIIYLNGVSSSGKSTLAAKLQKRLSEIFFIISSDLFMEMLSPTKSLEDYIGKGESGIKYLSAMFYPIKVFSDIGVSTIIDDVLSKGDVVGLKEAVELLHDYPVLFVHVTCPLEELRRREKERGDRDIGQGESQLSQLNPQDTYDITVDTTKEECADKIIEMLNYPDKWTAFKTLWEQRTE